MTMLLPEHRWKHVGEHCEDNDDEENEDEDTRENTFDIL